MKKNEYVSPEVEIVEMTVQGNILLGTSGPNEDKGDDLP